MKTPLGNIGTFHVATARSKINITAPAKISDAAFLMRKISPYVPYRPAGMAPNHTLHSLDLFAELLCSWILFPSHTTIWHEVQETIKMLLVLLINDLSSTVNIPRSTKSNDPKL